MAVTDLISGPQIPSVLIFRVEPSGTLGLRLGTDAETKKEGIRADGNLFFPAIVPSDLAGRDMRIKSTGWLID